VGIQCSRFGHFVDVDSGHQRRVVGFTEAPPGYTRIRGERPVRPNQSTAGVAHRLRPGQTCRSCGLTTMFPRFVQKQEKKSRKPAVSRRQTLGHRPAAGPCPCGDSLVIGSRILAPSNLPLPHGSCANPVRLRLSYKIQGSGPLTIVSGPIRTQCYHGFGGILAPISDPLDGAAYRARPRRVFCSRPHRGSAPSVRRDMTVWAPPPVLYCLCFDISAPNLRFARIVEHKREPAKCRGKFRFFAPRSSRPFGGSKFRVVGRTYEFFPAFRLTMPRPKYPLACRLSGETPVHIGTMFNLVFGPHCAVVAVRLGATENKDPPRDRWASHPTPFFPGAVPSRRAPVRTTLRLEEECNRDLNRPMSRPKP